MTNSFVYITLYIFQALDKDLRNDGKSVPALILTMPAPALRIRDIKMMLGTEFKNDVQMNACLASLVGQGAGKLHTFVDKEGQQYEVFAKTQPDKMSELLKELKINMTEYTQHFYEVNFLIFMLFII